MKLLVCISQAPDTTSRIAFTNGNKEFDSSGVQYIVNPYDEWYALVRAIELKEKHGGTVTTLTVGEAGCDPVIRKALAIGADDVLRIDAGGRQIYAGACAPWERRGLILAQRCEGLAASEIRLDEAGQISRLSFTIHPDYPALVLER